MTHVNPSETKDGPSREIGVWDIFVRVFHWSVVGLFVVAFVTADAFDQLHELAGYAILALVVLRIGWGFAGPRHARFASFVKGPGTIFRFLKATAELKAPRYVGHNPAGGAMVVALLAMLAVITLSGVLQTVGPFTTLEWIGDVHKGAVFITLGLVGLHLVGVLTASIEHAENLVRSMVTGTKRAPDA